MSELAASVLFVVVSALLQIGCHTSIAASSDADSSGDAIDGVMCRAANPIFPSFDKTCTTPDDCAIGVHQTNCCGSMLAIGMNKAELDRFTAAEKLCVGQYPLCGCPATPTMAEDGRTPIAGQMIVVECASRKCMTTVK